MRIICSCDLSGHLSSRYRPNLTPRSALLSSLDRGYPCFSPVGAVNSAWKAPTNPMRRIFFRSK